MIPRCYQAVVLGASILGITAGLKTQTKLRFFLNERINADNSELSVHQRITRNGKFADQERWFEWEAIGELELNSILPAVRPQQTSRGHQRTLKKSKDKVHHAHYFHGKGKGKGKSSKKSGKSKGSKKSSGLSFDDMPSVCSKLDFRSYYFQDTGSSATYTGHRGRSLQFEGIECSGNALDMARAIPDLSVFVGLVEAAHLEDIFRCAGPFTIMAPTNAAFVSNQPFVDFLSNSANIEDLRTILLYHMLPGLYLSESFEEGSIPTLQGDSVSISLSPLSIDQATVTGSDVLSCNGVLQVVTGVLTPRGKSLEPSLCDLLDFRTDAEVNAWDTSSGATILELAATIPDLSSFVALINTAGLSELFKCAGPFTFLAPSNKAFDEIDNSTLEELLQPGNLEKLQNLLLYHFLPGFFLYSGFESGQVDSLLDGLVVDVSTNPLVFNFRSNVVPGDNLASNGNILMIDKLLIPEPEVCSVFDYGSGGQQLSQTGCSPNVLETARGMPELSLSVTLLEKADLQEIFGCSGPFTALLPTNDAWAALDPALFEYLLRPENTELLEDILLYHILPGRLLSSEVRYGAQRTLLDNGHVFAQADPLRFDGTEVTRADVVVCNGVVHSLRGVLMPFTLDDATPAPGPASTNFPAAYLPPRDTDPMCDRFTFMGSSPATIDQKNILDVARSIEDLSLAVMLFERAGLSRMFNCQGPFTVQMPVNSAIETIDNATLEFLLHPDNVADLQNLLLYHVLPGPYTTLDLAPGSAETLLPGAFVEVATGPITFNDVSVLVPNIPATNGYIHVIDSVLRFDQTAPVALPTIPAPVTIVSPAPVSLLPPPAQTTSSPVVGIAGPVANPPLLGPVPVPGGPTPVLVVPLPVPVPVLVTAAPVGADPIPNDPGIDVVPIPATPPTTPASTGAPAVSTPSPTGIDPICDRFTFDGASATAGTDENILEVARGIDELSLAVMLFERAGLSRVFECPGPFTAQVPRNSAIESIDAATLAFLTQPENLADLQNLLLYHIIPGPYRSSELPTGLVETLLPGAEVDVVAIPPSFNSVNIVTPNIPASNGYIHIIDSVIRYRETATTSPTVAPTRMPTLVPTTGRPTTPQPTPPKGSPTRMPTEDPSPSPTTSPTSTPTGMPTGSPTAVPTTLPTSLPTETPTKRPTPLPGSPTFTPTTAIPTEIPSTNPSNLGSMSPSFKPSSMPSVSNAPSGEGTGTPTSSAAPSLSQSPSVSASPSIAQSQNSTAAPSTSLAPSMSAAPSISAAPSLAPSVSSAPSTSAAPSGTLAPGATLVPTSLIVGTGSPTVGPRLRIQVADFFIAYAAGDNAREPTDEEYEALRSMTVDYFNNFFEDYYEDRDDVSFLGLDSTLDFARYNAGFPDVQYNVYLQFSLAELQYSEGSNPLNAEDSFNAMRQGLSADYILNYVRKIPDSPFVTVDEVLFRGVSQDGPAPDIRSGSTPRSGNSIPLSTMAAASAGAAVLLFMGMCVYRRQSSRHLDDYTDGLYSVDHKVLEGYFSENENTNSMTEVSESNYSRFQPLPRVTEETYEDESIHHRHRGV